MNVITTNNWRFYEVVLLRVPVKRNFFKIGVIALESLCFWLRPFWIYLDFLHILSMFKLLNRLSRDLVVFSCHNAYFPSSCIYLMSSKLTSSTNWFCWSILLVFFVIQSFSSGLMHINLLLLLINLSYSVCYFFVFFLILLLYFKLLRSEWFLFVCCNTTIFLFILIHSGYFWEFNVEVVGSILLLVSQVLTTQWSLRIFIEFKPVSSWSMFFSLRFLLKMKNRGVQLVSIT